MSDSGDQLVDAFAQCRDLTRRRARNFYYGLRLLPEPQRSALFAVYAWMRRADDLVDDAEDPAAGQRAIDGLRRATEAAVESGGDSDDAVLRALGHVVLTHNLDPAHLHHMLDGQCDDLHGRTYATFDELREYCFRVASSVGLVCVQIWGTLDERAPELAIERGIAFQLTNILRDVVEDHHAGRVYIPREEFDKHELTPDAFLAWNDAERCARLALAQIARAESYYDRSAPLDTMITASCRPTLVAMTQIYRELLASMRRKPFRIVSGRRIRVSSLRKIMIMLHARAGLGKGAS